MKSLGKQSPKTVVGTKNDLTIELPINSTIAKKNGFDIALDVPAQIIDGRTLVPVRFIAESSGSEVGWNSESRTVLITSTSANQVSQTTTVAEKPATPNGLFAFGVSPTEIRIGWDYVKGVDNYHIYFSNTPDGPYELFSNDLGETNLIWQNEYSFSILDLDPNEISYIKVASVKNGVESEMSSYVKTETRDDYLSLDEYQAYLNAYAKKYDFNFGEHVIKFDEHYLQIDEEDDLIITTYMSSNEAEKMFKAFEAGHKTAFETAFSNTMISISEYGFRDAYAQLVIYEESIPFMLDKYKEHELDETHIQKEDGTWELIYLYYNIYIPYGSDEYNFVVYEPTK